MAAEQITKEIITIKIKQHGNRKRKHQGGGSKIKTSTPASKRVLVTKKDMAKATALNKSIERAAKELEDFETLSQAMDYVSGEMKTYATKSEIRRTEKAIDAIAKLGYGGSVRIKDVLYFAKQIQESNKRNYRTK